MTEARAIDLLLEHKAEVLAATAWEGFMSGGRGFMVTDGHSVSYMPASLAAHFRPIIRRRLQRLVKSYKPEQEIVVLLAFPVEGTVLLALGRRTPALPPEEAFFKWAGRPECPPMTTVRFPIPESGEKGPMAA